jgi:Zn-finger in ubiquitin-hydrolases and other protein
MKSDLYLLIWSCRPSVPTLWEVWVCSSHGIFGSCFRIHPATYAGRMSEYCFVCKFSIPVPVSLCDLEEKPHISLLTLCYFFHKNITNFVDHDRLTTSKTNLWLCLYPDCYMLGCTESPADHSTQHNRDQPEHCLQLNIVSWRAWCYACNMEVYLTRNIPRVRGVLGTADHNTVSSRQVTIWRLISYFYQCYGFCPYANCVRTFYIKIFSH